RISWRTGGETPGSERAKLELLRWSRREPTVLNRRDVARPSRNGQRGEGPVTSAAELEAGGGDRPAPSSAAPGAAIRRAKCGTDHASARSAALPSARGNCDYRHSDARGHHHRWQ